MNRPCCPRDSAKSLASDRARSRPHPAGTAPLTAVPGPWIQEPWPHGRVAGISPGRPPPGIDRLACRGRHPRPRGLGPHKNLIDRSGTTGSKGGPDGIGRMPAALTRASELSRDQVRRTPQVAIRCSRSHIPGSPMHPGGHRVNRVNRFEGKPGRGRVQRYPAPVGLWQYRSTLPPTRRWPRPDRGQKGALHAAPASAVMNPYPFPTQDANCSD